MQSEWIWTLRSALTPLQGHLILTVTIWNAPYSNRGATKLDCPLYCGSWCSKSWVPRSLVTQLPKESTHPSPVSPVACWQWCCHSRHMLESGLSVWEKIWIQVSHLSVAITISVWHNTATDNISFARWSYVDLMLLLCSEDRSRSICSGEGSGLCMEVTWCLFSGSFGRG